jgi:hypothetical protein
MSSLSATVNGNRATRLVLRIPRVGPWVADVDFDQRVSTITGAATITIGALTMTGTFTRAGSWQLQSTARIVAGAGGWSKIVKARHYHSDAGVKLGLVAGDLARDCGETIGVIAEPSRRLGTSFARVSGVAGHLLTAATSHGSWWVAADGLTHVADRGQTEIATAYEVLDYSPRERVATVTTDALEGITVGSVLRARLDEARVVRELEVTIASGKARMMCWCPEVAS